MCKCHVKTKNNANETAAVLQTGQRGELKSLYSVSFSFSHINLSWGLFKEDLRPQLLLFKSFNRLSSFSCSHSSLPSRFHSNNAVYVNVMCDGFR